MTEEPGTKRRTGHQRKNTRNGAPRRVFTTTLSSAGVLEEERAMGKEVTCRVDKETWFAFEQITSKRKKTNPDRGNTLHFLLNCWKSYSSSPQPLE